MVLRMASNEKHPENVGREWHETMFDQDINSPNLYDNRDDQLLNIPLSAHFEQLGLSSQDPDQPFIFYKVNELCQLSASNKLPKLRQVKTCGVYKTTKQRMYLVEPLQCEKEEFELDVNFELVGDLPPVGRTIEVYGYTTTDGTTKKITFNPWFWRERTENYNMIVELYLKYRKEYEESLLKT